MVPNFLVLAATALIPFVFAYIWFHPNVFGGDYWAKIAGINAALAKEPIKPLKLVLSIVLNFFIAFGLYQLTVHESGVFSMLSANTDLLKTGTAAAFLAEYGGRHLTFGHGLVHGFFATLEIVMPILGYVVIFEKKSAKYFWVYLAYWMISLMLMGGVIAQWGAQTV